MREKYQLSEREWQVMNFMWDQEKAVTSMDISSVWHNVRQ